jgi:alcohol dehydrogenase
MTAPETGTSAVVTDPGSVELREFDIPDLGPEEGLLSVELAGVCGSDPKAYRGEYNPECLPAILGHEILGRVEALGAETSERLGVDAGDRVVVEGRRRCGSCRYCLDGRYQFCERGGTYGFTSTEEPPGLWGAHGEYLYLAPGTVVHPIGESVPAPAAVLACAVVGNSINWLQSGTGDLLENSLVIQGCGPQALSMTAVAARTGVSPIVVLGVPGDERRLDLAADLGADHTICRPPGELVGAARDYLGGGADVVVNLTGTPATAQASVDLVGIDGTVVYPNVVGDATSELRLDDLVHKNARLQGVISRTATEVRRAVDLIERDPAPFERLVSHTYPVEEAERAYRVAEGSTDEAPLKVAIDPSA